MSDVGRRLKEEREKKRFTQVQVFKKTGINNKTLSGYENNVSYPDFESLKLLAELYDVTTDYLLGREEIGEQKADPLDDQRRRIANLIINIKDPEKKKQAIAYLEYLASSSTDGAKK